MKNLLILGHTFPEPSTTAAGCRMMQLINIFKGDDYEITFASTASFSEKSEDLESLGIQTKNIQLNNSSFDVFLKELNPSIVLFDRFISEEQFAWRVTEHCPDALKILDTEDLHFLRRAREVAFKKDANLEQVDLFTETTKREIASIYRCDLTLIISEFEMELLQNTFKVDASLLFYIPLLVDDISDSEKVNLLSFEERNQFITIGNLLHAPNVDSVLYLKKDIWPLIKEKLPKAELHIYGNYAPQQIKELHNIKEGFLIKGWAKEVGQVMQEAKVCLAPLRFGAGLKGKIMDAMQNGTPIVTSKIGAEGIAGDLDFSGSIEDTVDGFVNASVEFFKHQKPWIEAQEKGFSIINKRFKMPLFSEKLISQISSLQNSLKNHRETNFVGQILQHHSLQSTKYLSKWIEEKNYK